MSRFVSVFGVAMSSRKVFSEADHSLRTVCLDCIHFLGYVFFALTKDSFLLDSNSLKTHFIF